jgi:hypothetical protein
MVSVGVNSFDPTTNSSVWLTDCNFQYKFSYLSLISYKCKVFILQNYFILVIFCFRVGRMGAIFGKPRICCHRLIDTLKLQQCTPSSLILIFKISNAFCLLAEHLIDLFGCLVSQYLNLVGALTLPSNIIQGILCPINSSSVNLDVS